jgi:hypothetical protein
MMHGQTQIKYLNSFTFLIKQYPNIELNIFHPEMLNKAILGYYM